jgi:GNAT superfamily N-acetyltransferase
VLPERWGTGIGGRLLDAVIDEAKRRGGHHIYDTAGELPMGAILSEGRYSPTWRYGFYVEHGCGGLACWFRMHATRLIDQK